MTEKEKADHGMHRYDPVHTILSARIEEQDPAESARIKRVLGKAKRQVSTKDFLGLLLINLWLPLARMAAPLFSRRQHKKKHDSKGVKHE